MTTPDPLAARDFPDGATTARPIWLITLADLALLLVGFFVLLQAHRSADQAMLARAIRAGFGGATTSVTAPAEPTSIAAPLPLAAAIVDGFAPGSSSLAHDPAALIGWARDLARDPRTVLTITGSVDGSAADRDATTGSGTLLAADRARAVAGALAAALPGVRLSIDTNTDSHRHRRDVLVSLGFAGNRQDPAARQLGLAAPAPEPRPSEGE